MAKNEFIIYFVVSWSLIIGITILFAYFFNRAARALRENDNKLAGKYLTYISSLMIALLLVSFVILAINSATAFPYGAQFIDL